MLGRADLNVTLTITLYTTTREVFGSSGGEPQTFEDHFTLPNVAVIIEYNGVAQP